jgi:PAS domain S-box-containing protein
MAATVHAQAQLVAEIRELREKLAALEGQVVRHEGAVGEERFFALTDTAPVMIWMSGSDGSCHYFNRSWLEFRGRALPEEAGAGWTEGIHPEDRDSCLEIYMKALAERRPFHLEYRLQRADGEYRWIQDSGVPRFEPDGSFGGYMGLASDISDQRRPAWTPDGEAIRAVSSLTERERQVLVLIADGKSTKEAAACLGISYKTADSHRSRILEKLGVHETASMVRMAIRAGLIEP